MSKRRNSPPKYRHHKASGQAVVTINGTDHYLGKWNSKASKAEYDRLIGEWLTHGRTVPRTGPDSSLTVNELLVAYLRWAKDYYQNSQELPNIKLALRPLKALYGRTSIADFGPLALKAVRTKMIDDDLCRNEINKRIGRVKRVVKFGVENELVDPSVFHGLQAVRGLSRGRSEARESEPVKPVPEAYVDALESHVLPQVWTMIQLQRFTGMRPGEVTIMRTCDLDTTGKVWIYTPSKHKTAHHGHSRKICIGPRGQAVLRSWLKTDLQAYLFSPQEAMQFQLEHRSKNRKTPLSCGNKPGTNRKQKPRKTLSDCYSVTAYGRAIARACKKANIPHWHPHQLRHNAATWLRKEFGLDVARVILGHRSAAVTEVYAEVDFEKAIAVIGKVG